MRWAGWIPKKRSLGFAALLAAIGLPAMAEDLQMWERSGGNAGMVDELVADVEREEPRPQDQPDLHPAHRDGAEDRPGDRQRRGAGPDGHGPDLRAAVRGGRPARRHHRPDRGRPEPRRPRAPATWRSRPTTGGSTACRSMPTSRRCSGTRTCSARPASIRRSRRPASRKSASMPTRSPRSAAT